MIRRHGFAALTTTLLVVAVVLLALNEARAAVYVTLATIVIAIVGAAVTSAQRT
ncbi:MAG: hypothetical protein ACJ762_03995 [Solirubrobacteraceae bacterium]